MPKYLSIFHNFFHQFSYLDVEFEDFGTSSEQKGPSVRRRQARLFRDRFNPDFFHLRCLASTIYSLENSPRGDWLHVDKAVQFSSQVHLFQVDRRPMRFRRSELKTSKNPGGTAPEGSSLSNGSKTWADHQRRCLNDLEPPTFDPFLTNKRYTKAAKMVHVIDLLISKVHGLQGSSMAP